VRGGRRPGGGEAGRGGGGGRALGGEGGARGFEGGTTVLGEGLWGHRKLVVISPHAAGKETCKKNAPMHPLECVILLTIQISLC